MIVFEVFFKHFINNYIAIRQFTGTYLKTNVTYSYKLNYLHFIGIYILLDSE